jgi:hypothetical protein
MLRRVALVRTDVSEEPSASFIRVTRIGEVRTTLAVRFLQEPHGVTSQKTPFFKKNYAMKSGRNASTVALQVVRGDKEGNPVSK